MYGAHRTISYDLLQQNRHPFPSVCSLGTTLSQVIICIYSQEAKIHTM